MSGASSRRVVDDDAVPLAAEWRGGAVRLVDQRALPGRLRFVTCRDVDALCAAIADLTVRGAPSLGAAGAYGVALAARNRRRAVDVRADARRIVAVRPTAVNLAVGVELALAAFEDGGADAALAAARAFASREVERHRALGAHGAELVPDHARVLTHCHAGGLACVGYGSALGVVRAAHEAGKQVEVFADETRPLLQGARITAWELDRLGIPVTLQADAAAGSLLAGGDIDLVVVGADRIAANGDVANKVGTYPLAVLARRHHVPFYVAAPTSTIDLSTPDGDAIRVEDRDGAEVRSFGGRAVAPDGVRVRNPAFDVTPAALVTAIVCEMGVARRPYRRSLASHVRRAAAAG